MKQSRTIIITREIEVDECIADEIITLNASGVKTMGSCCGHGNGKPEAIIFPSSQDKARELGYEPYREHKYPYNEVIKLNSKCKCNQEKDTMVTEAQVINKLMEIQKAIKTYESDKIYTGRVHLKVEEGFINIEHLTLEFNAVYSEDGIPNKFTYGYTIDKFLQASSVGIATRIVHDIIRFMYEV